MAREVAEALVKASYEHRVQDTKTRLAKEVAVVCKDYCTESWGVAMDRARVPADSEMRKVENIFFPKDIREIPNAVPLLEQFSTTQSFLLGVGEETQSPMMAKLSKDALTIRDVVDQAKDIELKSQAEDSQSKKADPKKDPPQAKA